MKQFRPFFLGVIVAVVIISFIMIVYDGYQKRTKLLEDVEMLKLQAQIMHLTFMGIENVNKHYMSITAQMTSPIQKLKTEPKKEPEKPVEKKEKPKPEVKKDVGKEK